MAPMPMPNELSEERKELLLAAVNLLIRSPDAHEHLAALEALVPVARTFNVQLMGPAAPLNALLELKLKDPDRYERMLDLVEAKRREAGFDELRPQREAGRFDKTEYMRSFMAAKRERQRRAAFIENLIRPQRDRLVGRSRIEFMERQSSKWKRELDERVNRAREAQGGRLSKETLEVLRTQFWADIDKYLDDLEAEARKEGTAAVRRGKLSTSMAQLHAALAHDPYASTAA